MPVALSTSFTGWVALPLDNSRLKPGEYYAVPAPTDPAFEVRFLSERDIRLLDQALATRDKETFGEWRARAEAALCSFIVATRNMGESKSGTDALADLLDGEINDLASQLVAHSKLGYDELKKSRLPRSSGQAVSVQDAPAASAATTSPQT